MAVGLLGLWRFFGREGWSQPTRAELFPWGAVLIGCGVWIWFQLPNDPPPLHYALLGGLFVVSLGLRLWGPERAQVPLSALLCVIAGFLACGLRLWVVEAPVIDFRYYGPVIGRVVDLDRSQTDALRVTLDQVRLDRVPDSWLPGEQAEGLGLSPEGAGSVTWPDGRQVKSSFRYVHQKDRLIHDPVLRRIRELGWLNT